MRRRLDPDAARRMGGMVADYKPEAVSRTLDLFDVRLQRNPKVGLLIVQSQVTRKVLMSLPRVKWMETADV